jgi:hypothetical protein
MARRERRTPAEVAELLAGLAAPWWIAGGWALDLFVGSKTREHDDVDVAMLRRDQQELYRLLQGWDLRYATPERTLVPWDGRTLAPPVHEVWARRSNDGNAPWTFEVLLNEHDGDRWVYRRNPAVSRALEDVTGRSEGIPYLAPEIVLLYKSKDPTPKDEDDFHAVRPRLSASARAWLRQALETAAPRHPWLAALIEED